MRTIETRLSCLGLVGILAFAASGPELDSPDRPDAAELLDEVRTCRDWFAAAAQQPKAGLWARSARFRHCRRVIGDAVRHLDQHEATAGHEGHVATTILAQR